MRVFGAARAFDGGGGGGGGGMVDTVNGIAPVAGDVTLGATDIPYAPTFATMGTALNPATSVGAQLLWFETHTGTMSWIWDEPTLEAAFPVGAITPDTHTLNRPAYLLTPLGGAPIGLTAGNDAEVAHPGSIDTSGVQKVLLTGDVAGPLLKGEVVASGLGLLNTSVDVAAKDMQVESLAGRAIVQSDMATIGAGGVSVENVFGPGTLRTMVQVPAAGGATGITFGGTLGAILLSSGFAQAPPGGGYVAIDVLSSAVVASQFVVIGYGSVTLDPTDSFTRLDPAATYPGGPPLPTSGIGTQYFNITNQGPGPMYDPTGIGADDIRVFSLSHQSGPRSNWIGDAVVDTAGAPAIRLDHTGNAGLPLLVPADNSANGGAGGTLRTITLAAVSERHSYVINAVATDHYLQNNGPVGALVGEVSWRARAARSGGAGSSGFGFLERMIGGVGGWVTLTATESRPILLLTTFVTVGGSVTIKDARAADRYRFVWVNDVGGSALTDFEFIEILVPVQP